MSFLSYESLQAGEFGAGSTGDEERHVVIKKLQVWLALHTPGYKNVRPWAQWAAVELGLGCFFVASKHILVHHGEKRGKARFYLIFFIKLFSCKQYIFLNFISWNTKGYV